MNGKGLYISISAAYNGIKLFSTNVGDVRHLFNLVDDINSVFMAMYVTWLFWTQQANLIKLAEKTGQSLLNHKVDLVTTLGYLGIFYPIIEVFYGSNLPKILNKGNYLQSLCGEETCLTWCHSVYIKWILYIFQYTYALAEILSGVFFNMFEAVGLAVMLSLYQITQKFCKDMLLNSDNFNLVIYQYILFTKHKICMK